jgi:hypothetical protein
MNNQITQTAWIPFMNHFTIHNFVETPWMRLIVTHHERLRRAVNHLRNKRTMGFRHLLMLLILLAHSPTQAAETSTEEMTKRQINNLAERYISAIEEHDFEAWSELLSPLHPEGAELDETAFLKRTETIKSLSFDIIDGHNVTLQIKYISGGRSLGTLQIHPSGYIKYTPLFVKHPLYAVCEKLEVLLDDRDTFFGSTSSPASREAAASALEEMSIPLFNYDPLAPTKEERREAAKKTLEWLQKNGPTYDSDEPNVCLPPEEFTALMKQLTRAAK